MSTAGVSAHEAAAGLPVLAVSVKPVVIASPGRGDDLQVRVSAPVTGDGLAPFAAEHFPFMRPDFTAMTTPSLVVAGDHDDSPLSSRGPDWFTDAYRLSPSAQHLLTLFGGEHSLGGIAGYGVAETTDENPGRVAVIQQLTTAYLRTAFGVDPAALAAASPAAAQGAGPAGRLDSR